MGTPTYYIVAGRFQPFSSGHAALLEHTAAAVDGPIVIGIVNPDPFNPWPGDGEDWIRFLPKDNPLNYWERVRSIRLSINGTGLEKRVEAIVPLPRPSVNLERANRFLPPKPRALVLCEKWGDEVERWKLEAYKRNRETTCVFAGSDLPPGVQMAEGPFIRSLMFLRNRAWEKLVPKPSVRYLRQLDIGARLVGMVDADEARDAVVRFCAMHSTVPFAREVLNSLDSESDEEAADLLAPVTDGQSSVASAIARRLVDKLSAAPANQGEVSVQLEHDERVYLDGIVTALLRAGALTVVPNVSALTNDLFSAKMTGKTCAALLLELRQRES
jgi:hypothetical protein